ncbi:MAG: hypothetical protein MZV70_50510 [Desulfobacterales bacterium]|nr:hypothetical protein [Desulfobacterales bacterium]
MPGVSVQVRLRRNYLYGTERLPRDRLPGRDQPGRAARAATSPACAAATTSASSGWSAPTKRFLRGEPRRPAGGGQRQRPGHAGAADGVAQARAATST